MFSVDAIFEAKSAVQCTQYIYKITFRLQDFNTDK